MKNLPSKYEAREMMESFIAAEYLRRNRGASVGFSDDVVDVDGAEMGTVDEVYKALGGKPIETRAFKFNI